MRIAQIAALYKPSLGGLESVMHELSNQLVADGCAVTIFTSDYRWTSNYKDQKQKGLKILRLRSTRVAGLVIIPSLLYRLLRVPRFDIYHVHVAQAFIPETTLIAAKIKRAPMVAHFHLDVAPSGKFGFIFKAYKKFLLPRTLRSASRVVVFSEAQSQLVQQKYQVREDRVSIIPNGVREDFFYKGTRTLHARPRILFVGRLSPQKNVIQLLQALVGVSERFEVFIVGDGELRPELEQFAKDMELKNVHFTGRADGKEVVNFYAQSDIFVLPSLHEGMPLVLLEAMAMGLLPVVTDVPGSREIITDNKNGLIVPLNDSVSLQNKLLKLRNDSKTYKKLTEHARLLSKLYGWKRVAAEFEELYEATLERPL